MKLTEENIELIGIWILAVCMGAVIVVGSVCLCVLMATKTWELFQ